MPFQCPKLIVSPGEQLSKKQAAQEAQMRKLRAQVWNQAYSLFHFRKHIYKF